tara:strand:- start:18965 stop:19255 length:291 start_codon:yes stop_codon:yes gene_type:complete
MKTTKLKELLNRVTERYEDREVSIVLTNGKYEIIAKLNIDDSFYEIDSNIDLTETQEDLIFKHLEELWIDKYITEESFNSYITEDDREHALSLIYK